MNSYLEEGDTFDIVLSRMQCSHPNIIALREGRVLFFKQIPNMRLTYSHHYFPRSKGCLPVYVFVDEDGKEISFFGCQHIRSLIPSDVFLVEDCEMPLPYRVSITCDGFNREYRKCAGFLRIEEVV